MTSNIELYIDGQLADLSASTSIRVNRKLVDPAILNTKDAQMTYSITLPATARNNDILRHGNTEEVIGKFAKDYDADLLVGGVRIIVGKLKLSEITDDSYKGNLYVPALRAIQDVFADINLTDLPEWRYNFGLFATSVGLNSLAAKLSPQPCIFPLAMYGVLPKVPQTDGSYTARDIFDESVRLGMDNIPPSINVMQLMRHIFDSAGYSLSGTALNDDRLKGLYMSYRNASDREMPWNYGYNGTVSINGKWASTYNMRTGDTARAYEKAIYQGRGDDYTAYAVDMLDCSNGLITVNEDYGANVTYTERTVRSSETTNLWTQVQGQILCPVSGYYKVHLKASMRLKSASNWRYIDQDTGVQHVGLATGDTSGAPLANNDMLNKQYEVRLLRDRGKGDFGLNSSRLDGSFYRDNLPQDTIYPGDADFDPSVNLPKYMPVPDTNGQTLFIDALQDTYIVQGCALGARGLNDTSYVNSAYKNPLDTSNQLATMLMAKPCPSYDTSAGDYTKLAVPSPGYKEYNVDLDTGVADSYIWTWTPRFLIELNDLPSTPYAKRGQFDGAADDAATTGQSETYAVVWLDKGERLTVASVSEEGRYRQSGMSSTTGMTEVEVWWALDIAPYQASQGWLKIDLSGKGTAPMSWSDTPSYSRDYINLCGFLDAQQKVNDWIDNVCKAYNLQLSQTGEKAYTLDIKQVDRPNGTAAVDLDGIAAVRRRTNTPLNLPSLYKIGYTIDTEEEGCAESGDDGGGTYDTGVAGGDTLEQASSFSYNWFKSVSKQPELVQLSLPVISKAEPWDAATPYAEAMASYQGQQPVRMWYFDQPTADAGVVVPYGGANASIILALVTDEMPGRSVLNYRREPNSILVNFFNIMTDVNGHYTEVEAYLTPVQYDQLGRYGKALLNGDTYTVAEIQGYDPTGRNKAKIKLIKGN
jgi:hypothetical protein